MNDLTEPSEFPRNEFGWNQDFRNLGELIDLITTPTWEEEACASNIVARNGWNGTRNFEKAVELALVGWEGGLQKVLKIRDQLEVAVKGELPVTEVDFDVHGDFIDIDRYLAGKPETFGYDNDLEFRRNSPVSKGIHIVINIGASSTIQPDVIIARGAAIAAFISLLEMIGKRCEVDIVTATIDSTMRYNYDKSKWLFRLRIKEATEALDLSKLTMMVSHPSALRRLVFAAYERASRDAVNFYEFRANLGYYGTPVDIPEDTEDCEPYMKRRGSVYLPAQYSEGDLRMDSTAIEWIRNQLNNIGVIFRDEKVLVGG